jgi:hypothetical protein
MFSYFSFLIPFYRVSTNLYQVSYIQLSPRQNKLFFLCPYWIFVTDTRKHLIFLIVYSNKLLFELIEFDNSVSQSLCFLNSETFFKYGIYYW